MDSRRRWNWVQPNAADLKQSMLSTKAPVWLSANATPPRHPEVCSNEVAQPDNGKKAAPQSIPAAMPDEIDGLQTALMPEAAHAADLLPEWAAAAPRQALIWFKRSQTLHMMSKSTPTMSVPGRKIPTGVVTCPPSLPGVNSQRHTWPFQPHPWR